MVIGSPLLTHFGPSPAIRNRNIPFCLTCQLSTFVFILCNVNKETFEFIFHGRLKSTTKDRQTCISNTVIHWLSACGTVPSNYLGLIRRKDKQWKE